MPIIDALAIKPAPARRRPRRSETMAGDNPRNTGPMRASLRCGAKTRSGRPCRSPAVSGKRRCRMHGGAPGSGAPCGNKNALKSGLCTREALEERRRLRDFLRQARSLIKIFRDTAAVVGANTDQARERVEHNRSRQIGFVLKKAIELDGCAQLGRLPLVLEYANRRTETGVRVRT